jgi:hypothetical protein
MVTRKTIKKMIRRSQRKKTPTRNSKKRRKQMTRRTRLMLKKAKSKKEPLKLPQRLLLKHNQLSQMLPRTLLKSRKLNLLQLSSQPLSNLLMIKLHLSQNQMRKRSAT